MKAPPNIIITGIPRSGTTLTCHLLNKLPNFIALHEPMKPSQYFELTIDSVVDKIRCFFSEQRESIMRDKNAKSRSVAGAVPDNHIGNINECTGKRENLVDGDIIAIDKPLTKNFCLAIKHPNMFTALLQILSIHFNCYSIIRNPLSVLLSWNSVDMNVSEGHVPAAEAFDKNLSNKLKNEKNKYVRQIIILDWCFSKYKANLNEMQILRYEKIIETGGKALSVICDAAKKLNEPLKSKNTSLLYDNSIRTVLAELLSDYNGCYFDFYDKKDFLKLI